MVPPEYADIYVHFVFAVVDARRAFSVECCGDLVAVTGGGIGCFPLWSERESAEYFIEQHWPDLRPAELSLRRLLREVLPFLAAERVPTGIGMAPYPRAVLVPADHLRRDLAKRKASVRSRRSAGSSA